MIIEVRPDSVALLQDTDFTRFHVRLAGVDTAQADEALRAASAGRIDGDDALIGQDWLAGHANGRSDWTEGLRTMLDYARTKGWIADGLVKAHIEAV